MPTQRQIKSAIYLSGIKPCGYLVHHNLPGASFAIPVPSVLVGNIIVRALRAQAGGSPGAERAVITSLLAWAEATGGWDSSCWARAKHFTART